MEKFVGIPSGISDDIGEDEHYILPDQFVEFFNEFWEEKWLADVTSFAVGWSRTSAGIVENITLTPKIWIDRNGHRLQVSRYGLHDSELEEMIQKRREALDK